jgi:hypothetical protein
LHQSLLQEDERADAKEQQDGAGNHSVAETDEEVEEAEVAVQLAKITVRIISTWYLCGPISIAYRCSYGRS